jgi:hypothetical protein
MEMESLNYRTDRNALHVFKGNGTSLDGWPHQGKGICIFPMVGPAFQVQ